MRKVAIVGYAQTPYVRSQVEHNEVEMLMSTIDELYDTSGFSKADIDFTCSGSTDYLSGQAFSFVGAVDALGAWPPINESHVEMDGAWAMYESWVKIQTGEIDSALVFCFGRASMGDPAQTMILQLDPYTLAPLGADAPALAALQARAMIDAGKTTERQMAEVAARSRAAAKSNPQAQLKGDFDVDALLAEPYVASPLRKHDLPPITDGACAMIIAAEEAVSKASRPPVWITGLDHRYDSHQPGGRDLTVSPSTQTAGEHAGVGKGRVDLAELHAPFSHQEIILKEALGLAGDVTINASGGALSANPLMCAGLARLGEAYRQIDAGQGQRGVAHATSGPCLQQNLVAVLEGDA
ncbi:MAG: thiolase domain-containing protein [Myxococcota bacterium]|jgi:acetyl-CoA acetyltransferase|nr:thiolase domain-containing protein [Myxococcota bacterium]